MPEWPFNLTRVVQSAVHGYRQRELEVKEQQRQDKIREQTRLLEYINSIRSSPHLRPRALPGLDHAYTLATQNKLKEAYEVLRSQGFSTQSPSDAAMQQSQEPVVNDKGQMKQGSTSNTLIGQGGGPYRSWEEAAEFAQQTNIANLQAELEAREPFQQAAAERQVAGQKAVTQFGLEAQRNDEHMRRLEMAERLQNAGWPQDIIQQVVNTNVPIENLVEAEASSIVTGLSQDPSFGKDTAKFRKSIASQLSGPTSGYGRMVQAAAVDKAVQESLEVEQENRLRITAQQQLSRLQQLSERETRLEKQQVLQSIYSAMVKLYESYVDPMENPIDAAMVENVANLFRVGSNLFKEEDWNEIVGEDGIIPKLVESMEGLSAGRPGRNTTGSAAGDLVQQYLQAIRTAGGN